MDIFATKGAEYVIVLVYLVLLVGFWRFVMRPQVRASKSSRGAESERRAVRVGGWFEIRDDVAYHRGHTWVAGDGDLLTVGVDDFAQSMLGSPDSIELPAVGSTVTQGEPAWTWRVASRLIAMLAPIDGEVVGINDQVRQDPDLVAASPYDQGWLLKVRPHHRNADLKNLLTGRLAEAWMSQTVEQVRTMSAGDLGTVLPDGGTPMPGFVRFIEPSRWETVARDFLLTAEPPEAAKDDGGG